MRFTWLGLLLGAVALLIGGCHPQATRTLSRPPEAKPVLHLAVTTPTLTAKEAPAFKVSFTNAGGQALTLLKPVDGATDGMRCVSYEWKVERKDGVKIQPRGYGRCGNTNSIGEKDFETVQPGATYALDGGWLGDPGMKCDLSPKGVYRVQLVYKFAMPKGNVDGDGIRGGVRKGKAQELLKQTTEVTVASNWVEFTRQ